MSTELKVCSDDYTVAWALEARDNAIVCTVNMRVRLCGWVLAIAEKSEEGLQLLREQMAILQAYPGSPGWFHRMPYSVR